MRELDIMSFTANEMVTAIANDGIVDSYMEDRFERAAFAEYLADGFAIYGDPAEDVLYDLAHTTTLYEGDEVSSLYAALMDYREQAK